MDWKELEALVHDHSETLEPEQVQALSSELLSNVSSDTKPLQAAKVAYVLVLLQLRMEHADQEKAQQFLQYLTTILQHEIRETELSTKESAQTHLVYVRKIAEHYLHHLLMEAERVKAKKFMKQLQKLRHENHDALLKIQNPLLSFWRKEQKMISRAVSKHYVFAGFLLSIALYFSWTSFWELSDFAMSQWIYTEYTADSISFLMREGLLLIFAASFVWGFARYQGEGEGA
ncbi:MAG: hypothetical protein AB7J40_00670 [Candidatus Altimarinota bacterium]